MPPKIQIQLPPMGLPNIDQRCASGETSVDQATALLRRAVCDCGYTLDALQAAMGKGRAYIHKVLQGDKPVSLMFIVALPEDVGARFAQLRCEQFGFVVVMPATGEDAAKHFVSGLFGLLARKIA